MNKKYLIVCNPVSGKRGQGYLNQLTRHLDSLTIVYDIYHTDKTPNYDESRLNKLLDDNNGGYSDIVIIGGDGTLNMMSNVLAHRNIPAGIIPCGTGNDFSRNIYKKEPDVISIATGEKQQLVDLGWCNDRYFINILGIGYDAKVVEATQKNRKKLFRSLIYLWTALKYLPFYKEASICFKADAISKNEPTFITVFANGAYFGNGMNVTPKANIADGLLDCCWVGKIGFLKRCFYLSKIFTGSHLNRSRVEYVQGEQFHVLSERQPIEADGEFMGYTPAIIRIEKNALLIKIA